jgi:hypothetical protein
VPTARSPHPSLTLRALNRATLARQMLLVREKTTVPRVIERLVALQAQWPRPPFLGLWSRMKDFRRQDLTRLLVARRVVRATSLRATLHLMTAKDYVSLRAAIQPALTQGSLRVLQARVKGLDLERLVATARAFFEEEPRTFEELRDFLVKGHPKGDIRAMAYFARTHLPLVQGPSASDWGFAGVADFAVAESWLGKPLARGPSPGPLVLRYLAAFGPATPSDAQAWSGLPAPSVRDAFTALRPRLIAVRGERGRELFDLPKAPRPPEDAPAPVRFLPEFDNLLHSHVERRRFLADRHRRFVFLPALRDASTFLVDGFVAGTWKIERKKETATFVIEPFSAPAKGAREALAKEGEALARFVESEAREVEIRFAKPRE